MSETGLKNKVLKHLEGRGGVALKLHGNAYQRSGEPDVLYVEIGQAYLIEFKATGNNPTRI